MRLHVMRHGPAEDRAPTGRDADRRLTLPGRGVVEVAARRLLELRGARVPRIVASPLARAQETAEIVWRLAGDPAAPPDTDDALSTDAPTPIALAHQVARRAQDALLVGHNPNVEDLLRELVDGPLTTPGVRTGMIFTLEPPPTGSRGYRLLFVIDPHH